MMETAGIVEEVRNSQEPFSWLGFSQGWCPGHCIRYLLSPCFQEWPRVPEAAWVSRQAEEQNQSTGLRMGDHHRPKQESGRQEGSQEAQTVRPDVPFPVMWKSNMGWVEGELEKAVGLEFHFKIMEC